MFLIQDKIKLLAYGPNPRLAHVVETSTLDGDDWAEIEAAAKMVEGAAEKIRAALGKREDESL